MKANRKRNSWYSNYNLIFSKKLIIIKEIKHKIRISKINEISSANKIHNNVRKIIIKNYFKKLGSNIKFRISKEKY